MIQKIFTPKVIKFLLGGGVAATLNLILMYFFIEKAGFTTDFLENIANIISIEISLIFSFFVYRIWVWQGGSWKVQDILLKQLPLYHVSAGSAVVLRVFVVFPLLNWLGVSYSVNTLIGVLLSAILNYLISDRFVFANKTDSYPEALEPGVFTPYNQQEIPESSANNAVKLLSLVIPAHNEEDCIVDTINAITTKLEAENIDYDILIVNDNSKDNTETILQQLHEEKPKVRYINNYYPNGFGFAVRCGLENFKGDAVAVVMADNSDSPDNMVDYYHKIQEGYDCVFGSRFIKGGKVIDYPQYKLIVNRLANLFISTLFGFKYNDTTNAFKMYRKEVIQGISPLVSHHFNLTVEMPLKAIVRKYSYAIIPITWRNRASGISKLKLKEMGSRYLFIVLYIWLEKHLSRGDYIRKHEKVIMPSQVKN